MKAAGVILAILLIFSETAWTQSNTVYNFLRNDVSARAAALAGSFVTMADDPNALFYNPASVGTLERAFRLSGFFQTSARY